MGCRPLRPLRPCLKNRCSTSVNGTSTEARGAARGAIEAPSMSQDCRHFGQGFQSSEIGRYSAEPPNCVGGRPNIFEASFSGPVMHCIAEPDLSLLAVRRLQPYTAHSLVPSLPFAPASLGTRDPGSPNLRCCSAWAFCSSAESRPTLYCNVTRFPHTTMTRGAHCTQAPWP